MAIELGVEETTSCSAETSRKRLVIRGPGIPEKQRLDAGVDARIVEDFRGHGRLLTEEDRVLEL